MVAAAPPPQLLAPHPSPWYALEGGGIAETAEVEVSIEAGTRLFNLPRP